MAFRYSEMGQLLSSDPEEAHAQLSVMFSEHNYGMPATAHALGCDRKTLYRWCYRLIALGYRDPRADVRQPPGRQKIV